ncbi:MAG: methylated-DNA--[protein]-cysteine S-methyltransferase [Xanthomonadales bacterium]|nr:methylated-DNA--[protein]-cysteine S-methyltransferase [Xanthomonadales bacterium]
MADYAAIYSVIASIPAGTVASYGRIARLAGLPRRARLVGTALRRAPKDLDLPWHRVIRADGRLAFPEGSDAYHRQRRLLEDEGVTLCDGRVDLEAFGWDRPLDAILWGPRPDEQ